MYNVWNFTTQLLLFVEMISMKGSVNGESYFIYDVI